MLAGDVPGQFQLWVVTMHKSHEHLRAFHVDEGRQGGYMNPRDNPKIAGAILFQPARKADRTDSEKRAFQKRVAKRRAKKGYR